MGTVTTNVETPAEGKRIHVRVIYLGHADDPASPSSSHALDDIDEVRFHRGRRSVERRGRVLELAFPDERMSTDHGRWFRREGRWWIDDPESKNRTVIDGEIVRSGLVHDGAVIDLGHSFFLFREVAGEGVPSHLAGDIDVLHLPQWPPGLATFSPALAHTFEKVIRIAATASSVLLVGETGTGKEVVARAIHTLSGRTGKLVAVNCGALPTNLVEAELFGHRRGAFSGAEAARSGLVRSADKGTLFLDEIGELPPAAQAALLRVLQQREVLAIGEDRPVAVEFRLISATLRDLEAAETEGRFRPDLHARVKGHVFALPALRERREDLGLLVATFRAQHRPIRFAARALRALLRHDWPHNIRELEHAIAAAIEVASGAAVELGDLPEAVQHGRTKAAPEPLRPPKPPPPPHLNDKDRALYARLTELLAQHEGNVRTAAKELGKERSQLYKWFERLGIDPEAFRSEP